MLDASVALTWALPDEQTLRGDELLAVASRSFVHVPSLFLTEIANVLSSAERRKRINAPQVDAFLRSLDSIQLTIEEASLNSVQRALTLAREHGLTVYDATYLDLALQSGLPLATFDQALARAARKAGAGLA